MARIARITRNRRLASEARHLATYGVLANDSRGYTYRELSIIDMLARETA